MSRCPPLLEQLGQVALEPYQALADGLQRCGHTSLGSSCPLPLGQGREDWLHGPVSELHVH